MNLLQMPCDNKGMMILTSEVVEAVIGQKYHIADTLWHCNSTISLSHSASSAYQRFTKK